MADTREKLIEILEDAEYQKHYPSTLASILIANGVSLRKKGEWISVEDRLPERGQEVIVYRNDCVYSMRFWDKKHPLWESTSHWMPLPEPPAED